MNKKKPLLFIFNEGMVYISNPSKITNQKYPQTNVSNTLGKDSWLTTQWKKNIKKGEEEQEDRMVGRGEKKKEKKEKKKTENKEEENSKYQRKEISFSKQDTFQRLGHGKLSITLMGLLFQLSQGMFL